MKPLRSMNNERKDVIGPWQGLQARPGYCDQLGRPYYGPGQARTRQRGYGLAPADQTIHLPP